MSLKFHHQHFVSSSSSSPWPTIKQIKNFPFRRKLLGLDHLTLNRYYTRKKTCVRLCLLDDDNLAFSCKATFLKHYLNSSKPRRVEYLSPYASADDGVTVNGSPRAQTSSDVEDMRMKLDQSLQSEDYSTGLVQLLHDAARVFELAIKEQSSLSKTSWFSTAWLGADKTAWIKVLSYQASVYSLLQAASEISSRGDRRDRDINVFVQRSILRQSAPLENVIREKLLAKQPEVYDWLWSEQLPTVMTSFINYFEKDQHFAAATAVSGKGMSSVTGNASDISLLMLALSCIAAITKLGPTKVSCAQFFSITPDITGRLMDKLVEFIPIRQVYHSIKDIGLRREFLVHFGPRAAALRVTSDRGTEELIFWVSLVQKQLQRAIDRERIWSRLTTCESIEVLERDLAIFGFFIALGRSTKSFLSASGFDAVDEPLEAILRYLVGGSVLYYPQLSSISSYQLYVEVVCEELDWLPFYPGCSNSSKHTLGHKSKEAGPPNAEAIPQVLNVCFHWIESFIKYSKWLENPSNVKAARFLSKGHNKLKESIKELGIQNMGSKIYSPTEKQPDSFDKALESVEDALIRLEGLLQELHVSSSNSGKEHLKAACSDLERIRRLKKEAEFLEASFRAKAASLQQGDEIGRSQLSIGGQQQFFEDGDTNGVSENSDKKSRMGKPHGLWSFLVHRPSKSAAVEADQYVEESSSSAAKQDSESTEIQRFELLRNELKELEKRVQKSTDRYEYEEDEIPMRNDTYNYSKDDKSARPVQIQRKENVIGKSLDKLKETSTDVWQGTQLLAIDVAAAMGLLRRVIIGDELTEKEKQSLRRTLTDLASVVPIGFLMLLPVTAVGHAAMLAAIQRYVPALIPSTYGPERLDLLRQLEKVKEMEREINTSENAEE